MRFLVLINFKAYKEGAGRKGLGLARTIDRFRSARYLLAVAPSPMDLREIAGSVKIPVFAQHIDTACYGAYTGAVPAEGVKAAGAAGTLLNHSEKRIGLRKIKEGIGVCRKLKLVSVVCAEDLGMIRKLIRYSPNYIAYEPRRLIGKNVSVTSANPEIIRKAAELMKGGKTKLLAGAGVHSREDILRASELGAAGVLIAHKAVKAKNPGKILKQLLG